MPLPSQIAWVAPRFSQEDLLVVGALEAGVADLHEGVEQALLGGEDRALAVDVDGPALEHDRPPLVDRAPQLQVEGLRRALGDLVVLPVVRVLGPAVEAEARDRHLGLGVLAPHADGPEVARPAAVGRPAEELDAPGRGADPLEDPPRLRLVRLRGHEDADDLALRQLADDLAVDPRDGREAARPVGEVVRPAEPGGLVLLPLRGHAEGLDVGVEGGARQGLYSRSRNRRSIPA